MNAPTRVLSLLVFLSIGSLPACGGSAPHALEPAPAPPAARPAAKVNKPLAPAAVKLAAPVASTASTVQSPAAASPFQGSGPDGYKLAWVTNAGEWNHGLAFGPSGDVIAVGGHRVMVLARDTGRVLESAGTCFAPAMNSVTVLDAKRGLIACADKLLVFAIPGLTTTEVASFDGFRVGAAAFAPGRVAVGGDKVVRVFDTAKWSTLMDLTTQVEVESLALSRDGAKLVIGYKNGVIELRTVGSKAPAVSIKKVAGERRVTGLAVSPNGSELFANDATFKVSTYAMRAGAPLRQYEVGSWISTAVYLSATTVATAGSDGLLLMLAGHDKPEPFQMTGFGSTAEGLAASPDGSMLCSGDRSNHLFCFAKQPIASSTYTPSPQAATANIATAPNTVAPAASATAATQEHQGTIGTRTGKSLTLQIAGVPATAVGTQGSILRRFSQNLGSLKVTGWLEVADVIVRKVDARSVVVEVTQEKSDIRVNGQRVDHFAPGETIKLQLP